MVVPSITSSRLSTLLLSLSAFVSILSTRTHNVLVTVNVAEELFSFLPPLVQRPISLDPLATSTNEASTPRGPSIHSVPTYIVDPNSTTNFTVDPSDNSPPWAVFYNIYVPHSNTTNVITDKRLFASNLTAVVEILRDQLGQIGSSYAGNYQNKTLKVYYNTIGEPLNHTLIDEVICRQENGLDCIHMQHFYQAFEEKTLGRVQEYCRANPHHRVSYAHSKGSFHNRNGRNTHWRRAMTYAITHQDCMEPPDDRCDMCGLNFYVLPWLHFSGNFFTARCSYINQLLPVEEFRLKMNVLHEQTNLYEQQSRFLFYIFKNQPSYMGLGRYASEAWAGSHPNIVACDLSIQRQVDFWKRPQNATVFVHNFNFSLAPRPTDASGKFLHIRRTKRNQLEYIMREYYLLAGNMFKWIHLYDGKVPSKTSWVWNFFPQGDIWWAGYRNYAEDVVEGLLDPYALEDGNLSQWKDQVVEQQEREKRKEKREKRRQRRNRRRWQEQWKQKQREQQEEAR